jgi:hypothetical protein
LRRIGRTGLSWVKTRPIGTLSVQQVPIMRVELMRCLRPEFSLALIR